MSKRSNSAEFNQLLDKLYSLQRRGIKVGLGPTKKLLHACGNPQNNFTSIHIAGTNGKGSTAAILASILITAGYKVGLYISPHLLNFNERIRINGIPITNNEITEFMARFDTAIEEIHATFFETTTAMAFQHFNNHKVDVAVVETGLGGRLDSTNVLKPKLVAITPIAHDHTGILGKTLSEIAFEKSGIIKEKTPLILAPQDAAVKKVLSDVAITKKAEIVHCDPMSPQNILISPSGTKFNWKGLDYFTRLIGEHQASNAILAIETSKQFDSSINYESIKKSLANVVWPGRLQKMSISNPIFYDVAHNAHGIQVVLETLSKMYTKKPIGLIALKADKELEYISPKIKNKFQKLIVTSLPEMKLMPAYELQAEFNNFGIDTKLETDLQTALKKIKSRYLPGIPRLIFGSHYIAEPVFKEFDFSFDNGVI